MLLRRGQAAGSADGQGEVEELGWFAQVKGMEDGLLAGGGCGSLGDLPVAGGEGDQVHAVQLVVQVGPPEPSSAKTTISITAR